MLHVDDAVNAFLAAGTQALPSGVAHMVCNVGGTRPLSLYEIAQTVMSAADAPQKVRCVPFPAARKRIDIGNYHADDRKLRRWAHWKPDVEFNDGIARTIAFYRKHASQYLSSAHSTC
jgi:UDP-glucose 4-epimerase